MMMSAIIIWAHLSIIRKFEDERKPLFSRLRAILFYLTFFILTAGFFIPGEEEISAGIMAGISALIAAITMISSIENAPSFIERMSAKAHEKRTINYWYGLKNSNLCTCLLLVMLWLLSLSAVLLYSGDINGQTVLLLLSVTSGFILLSVISETATQLKPSANHIYYLAVTVAAIYLILPIILGEVIVVLSPLGGILFIIELTSYYGHDIKPEDIYVGSAVSIVSNLFFSGVVYHILHNKYVKNVNMIRQMLSN
jgi:hypothetical protein